jgi:hypothetical protein
MFCWPCIIVHQYSETNVMHFLFSLLRINGIYMFRALLAHPQEALQSGTWYIACVLCQLAASGLECSTPILMQPTAITRTQYTKCRLWSASWGWAGNARNMYRPLILNKLNKKCITLFSLYWCTVMHGQQNINPFQSYVGPHPTLWFSCSRHFSWSLTLSNPIFLPPAYSPALIFFWAGKRLVDYL